MRRSPGTLVTTLLCALLAGLLPAARATAAARPATEDTTTAREAPTYHNPLTAGVVDAFPDPVMIRGKDGLWYAVATQERTLPAAAVRPGKVGVAARGAGADADNVGAAALHTPVTTRVPERLPGPLLPAYSDDFDTTTVPGTTADSPWSWVRGPASGVTMADGALPWPTQGGELYLGTNTASVLTRDAPPGDYTVETRLRFAPGRTNQQAGLVLYGNDDRYLKRVHAVLPVSHTDGKTTHVTEFAKEGERPTTPPTPVAYGPMFGGPPADTLWMRLSYHADTARDETEVSAATSTDGAHWVHTGVWTLPTSLRLRIGLVAQNTAGALARFDYVRTYRR
ncbi:beta-xylosidase family glycoside hydrolase [Streptomyces melanosporofaciens]